MDIYFLGQACFKIKGKNAILIIDPFDPFFTGLKLPKDLSADLVLITHQHQDHNFTSAVAGSPLIISGPGEYEKSSVSVVGIKSFHDKQKGAERGINIIYQISIDGINIVHLGDLGHILTDEQSRLIEAVDILMVPVGNKYTLNIEDAAKVVADLEPKIVIPMHYQIEGLKIEGLLDVKPFLKEMGAENVTAVPRLNIVKDKLPETTTVVVLNKTF